MTVPAATVTQYYTGIFRQAPSAAVSTAYQAMPTANDALNSMLSAANASVDPVVRLYQTAFNRVPDSAGMTAWVVPYSTGGITLQAIANGFTQSTEFTTLYPTTMSNSQFVGALYWNILQRQGEAAGIQGWVDALNKGALTRAQVLLGFSDSAEFVAKIETNVNAFLTGCANNTQTYTGNLFDQGGGSAVVTQLTTGADNPKLSAANDIIDGAVTANGQLTWQTWDTINGGAGNDVLNAGMNGNTVSMVNVSSVETLNLDLTGAAATVNAAVATYIQNINVSDVVGFTVNSLGSVPAISLTGTGATTINFDASALAPAAQTLAITLNAKTAGALTISDTGSNALETVSIISSTAANVVGGITVSGLGATTLNVSGNQNVTLGAITDANTTMTTINASTLTGSMSVTALAGSSVTGGSGNDTITSAGGNDSFVGGTGNDTFAMSTFLTTADTIDGGDGTDTVSTTIATANGLTAARTTQTITNTEILAITDAGAAAAVVTSGISSSINTVYFNAGTAAGGGAVTGPAGSLTVRIGDGTAGVLGSALTLTDTGTATTDAATLNLNGAAATDAGAAQNVATVGYETLAISTNTSSLKGAQSLGTVGVAADVGGTVALTISGANALTVGVVTATAGRIDASGLTMTSGNGLTMVAGLNTATTLIGSAGNDTLFGDNGTDRATSVTAGAGNDSITTYGGADTIAAGDGNDTISSGTGNDSINAGAGNDRVEFATASLTANDTVVGGDGTDTLSYTTFTAASANLVAAQARVSEFEVLRVAGTTAAGQALTMSNYINNTGFTTLELGTVGNVAWGVDVANASSTLNTVKTLAAVIGTNTFDRLTDTSADALTISNSTSGAGGASTMTAFTALDEETITITASVPTTAGANDLTITTLTVADLKTLNITSASDVIITDAIAGASALTTVDASTATGAVTVNAANGAALTMTGNAASTAVNTFTGGVFADVLTGGGGADVLVGGGNADTISGGAGADNVTGGTGADSMTGGTGVDNYNQALASSVAASATSFAGATVAAGDTLTFANGVDVITDFAAGAAGDTITNATANGLPTTLIGETVADLTAGTEVFFASGTYNAATGRFTVLANGTGADTLIVYADNADAASDALTTNASIIVLVGVDSDNLVAGNFL